MTKTAEQLSHAAIWAASVKRDRAKRVARKFGDEAAPAILAEAARIEAARNARLDPAAVPPAEVARRAAEKAERAGYDGVAELFAMLADRARRAGEAAALRRRVLASLRRLGFRRETTSGQSAYYLHLATGLTVRISDHDVPLTAARESDMAHGGHTWALTDLGLVIDGNTTAREAGEWLVAIRRKIQNTR